MKQIVTSLDVGTDKIKLIVGEIYNKRLNVLVCEEVKSSGIKKGLIVNPEAACKSIKEAFDRCEEILGTKIKNVIVCVPSYLAEFVLVEGYTSVTREDKIVTGEDIVRAMQASVYNKVPSNKELVSIMPLEYILNDKTLVDDPKGKEATRLTIKSLISLIPKKNIYNLMSVLDTLEIEVSDISFNSLADYYEYKEDKYKNLNGAIINIGEEKTEVSIIEKNTLVSNEVLEIGGVNIDKDIMYMYNVDRKTAKMLKETFALASKENASTSEMIEVQNKEGINIKINQYELTEVIYSRIKDILTLTKKQINILTKKENSYIIITGGSSELRDMDLVVEEIFGISAKVGTVKELGARNNKFGSALGLIKYYYDKLSFRNTVVSTMSEEEIGKIFNNKKKTENETILGKIFNYFFNN